MKGKTAVQWRLAYMSSFQSPRELLSQSIHDSMWSYRLHRQSSIDFVLSLSFLSNFIIDGD